VASKLRSEGWQPGVNSAAQLTIADLFDLATNPSPGRSRIGQDRPSPDEGAAVGRRPPLYPEGAVDLLALPIVDPNQDAKRLLLRLARGSREEVREPVHRLRLALVDPPDVEERLPTEPCMPRFDDLPQHVEVGGFLDRLTMVLRR